MKLFDLITKAQKYEDVEMLWTLKGRVDSILAEMLAEFHIEGHLYLKPLSNGSVVIFVKVFDKNYDFKIFSLNWTDEIFVLLGEDKEDAPTEDLKYISHKLSDLMNGEVVLGEKVNLN